MMISALIGTSLSAHKMSLSHGDKESPHPLGSLRLRVFGLEIVVVRSSAILTFVRSPGVLLLPWVRRISRALQKSQHKRAGRMKQTHTTGNGKGVGALTLSASRRHFRRR